MKKALITGVNGQDGSYLAKFLLEKGYKVIGTTRNNQNSKLNNLNYLGINKDITIEELDLLDFTNIIRLIQKYNPNEVYNLASQSSVGLSFKQPIGTFSFNTNSHNNLLEAIRLINKKIKIYHASSSEMYGHVKELPITLNTPMHPVSPYAISKMATHFMTINYRESYDLFACNGVLFNHESFLRPENFFIKKIIKGALNIKKGLQKNLEVGNLNIKRDFGYAPKYVEAMWKMMQLEKADDFIICSGKPILLRKVVEYIFEKLEVHKKLIISNQDLFRPNEIFEIYGCNKKAKSILNWNYDYSFYDVLDKLLEEELNDSL